MPKTPLYLVVGLIFAMLAAGCTSEGETSDTSPAKPSSPESRIQAIENSDMSPEQKASAIQYVKQGQNQGDLMKKSYDKTTSRTGQ